MTSDVPQLWLYLNETGNFSTKKTGQVLPCPVNQFFGLRKQGLDHTRFALLTYLPADPFSGTVIYLRA